MHPFQKFEDTVLSVFRMDLQLHFFWSFSLTILALFWKPFIISGLVVTLGKETFDVAAKKGWSWGDVIWGIAGCGAGLVFLWYNQFF
ncbi:MAG: hypothetical protein D3926_00335 [Desulfobacteraceae bacterium]|nr:MAG: hypothetical protein D3926_00335 [Desulfobacteraceae bacterium]